MNMILNCLIIIFYVHLKNYYLNAEPLLYKLIDDLPVIIEKRYVSYLFNKFSNDTVVIIYKKNIDFVNLSNPKVILNLKRMHLLNKFIKLHNYIFYLDTYNDLMEIATTFIKMTFWNTRGYFVVRFVNKVDVKEVLEIFWKYKIYNVNVISNSTVFTFNPYSRNNCGEKVIPYELIDCLNGTNKEFFPNKIPLNLNSCNIKALPLIRLPFVFNATYAIEDPKVQGYEVTMLSEIGRRINANIVNVAHNFDDFGIFFRNGSSNKMFKMLQEMKADILFGGAFAIESHEDFFDTTYPHGLHLGVWWVPTAGELPLWTNLIRIFDRNVWMCIIGCIFIHSIVCWSIDQYEYNTSFVNTLLASFSVYLQISVKYPKTIIVKNLILLWSFVSLLLYSIYQSQLVSVLTNPYFEKQIDSVEDIIASNLQFGFYNISVLLFDKKYPLEREIIRKYIPCSLGMECVNRTAFKKDFCILKNDKQIEYWIPYLYISQSGRLLLHKIDNIVKLSVSWIYTVKGFPLLDRINDIIMRLVENGLINKWEKDMKFVVRREISEDYNKPLTLNHLQTAFYILIFGLIISILIYLIEIYAGHKNSNKLLK